MNIQAMMKQAQKINKTEYTGSSSFVTVIMMGDKTIKEIKIDNDNLDKEEIEMLQDMLVVAINQAMKQIDEDTNKKLGKYTQGMPGLF